MPAPPVPSGVVTLLTDFGLSDPYVGVMQGVMLGIAPSLRLVSLTHAISPQDVRAACFWLGRCVAWFPPGTVHLAVVDPGVGTARRPLVIESQGQWFVGPDNGIFTSIVTNGYVARSIDVEALGLGGSRTFHGRDVFAPVAAQLASGALCFRDAGPVQDAMVRGSWGAPRALKNGLEGEVVTVDHFGNLLTNIEYRGTTEGAVEIDGRRFRVVGTYGEANDGECVALFGSFGMLEIAMRNGNASGSLTAPPGTKVLYVQGELT